MLPSWVVHPLRTDVLALTAARQQLAQRRGFQFLAVQSLPQQVDALLQNRADALVAPGLDQRPRKRVLLVGKRYREPHRHETRVLLDSTAVNGRESSPPQRTSTAPGEPPAKIMPRSPAHGAKPIRPEPLFRQV